MMLPSARFVNSRTTASVGFACLALALCLISLGEGLEEVSPSSLVEFSEPGPEPLVERSWESEQGAFSPNHPDQDQEKLPTFLLPNPAPTPLSVLASILAGGPPPLPGNPTQPNIPSPSSSGSLLRGVLSILGGPTNVVPGSPLPTSAEGSDSGLGGLLSVLSQVQPVSEVSPMPSDGGGSSPITAQPPEYSGSGSLFVGLHVLGGVADALDGVLGGEDNGHSGLLGQISAKVLGPISSIVADVPALLADPTAAVNGLQNQVHSFLDSLPSAVAAGVQLANNVGGEIADALNATTEVLETFPEVAGGVADQIGSLLNAAPDLATGLPAAALSAVDEAETILDDIPGIGEDLLEVLDGLKGDLNSAAANAIPEVASLVGAVEDEVVNLLPAPLKPLVLGTLAPLRGDMRVLLCHVSSTVGGKMIVLDVPCDQAAAMKTAPAKTGSPASRPPSITATMTVSEMLPPQSPSSPRLAVQFPSARPDLTSILSSLSSSLISAAPTTVPTGLSDAGPVANAALSGLSSLIGQLSTLSLVDPSPPTPPLVSQPPPSAPPAASSSSGGETTIYYVRTITELITATSVQISTVTQCPATELPFGSAPTSPVIPYGPLPPTGTPPLESGYGAPSTPDPLAGPCPGRGYTCDDCLDGYFCPPAQTPALPGPNGLLGWVCYHCRSGWFFIPSDSEPSTSLLSYAAPSTIAPPIKIPTLHPATNGFQYAGCFIDGFSRALGGSTLIEADGTMTNGKCINYCQSLGYSIAGTEHGSECYCGNRLLDSYLEPNRRCNTTCDGDATAMCGGPWALSVWSLDGTVEQGLSPQKSFTLASTPGFQHPGGIRQMRVAVATPVCAWPPPPATDVKGQTAVPDVPALESAVLSAIASEASRLASTDVAGASSAIHSVESFLSFGMVSVADMLNSITSAWQNASSSLALGPGPVITSSATSSEEPSSILARNADPPPAPVSTRSGSRFRRRRRARQS